MIPQYQPQNQQFQAYNSNIKHYVDTCPVSLLVSFTNNQLIFHWDCKNIQAKSSFFSRHIVIIHTETFTQEQIHQTLRIYYKYLKLGDFMRVILINSRNKVNWIEKTSQKLDLNNFKGKNEKTTKSIFEQVFKNAKLSSDPTLVSVFTKNFLIFNNNYLQMLLQAKLSYEFNYIFNFFHYQTQQPYIVPFTNNFQSFSFTNLAQLQTQIKYSSFQLSKVRLLKSQIRIRCQNGQLDLRKFVTNRWKTQKDQLVLNNFALKNNVEYYECISLQTSNNILVCLDIEFKIVTIDNQHFLMNGSLAFHSENRKSANTDMIPQFNKQPLRGIQYSVMNKDRFRVKAGDKVIVREKKK